MLSDAPAVEEVLFGAAGVIHGARPGSVIIDSSTISPLANRDFGERLARLDVTMLDAPVSGGQKGAIEGTLSFMVGGDEASLERVLPVLQAMGRRITRIGELGAGQIAKACNQAIIAVSLLGISEALLLARRSGVDPAGVREALLGGAAGSPLLEIHGQRMLDRSFQPGFRAALHHKDIGIARSLARAVRLPTPALSLAEDMFASVLARGMGEAESLGRHHDARGAGGHGVGRRGRTGTLPSMQRPRVRLAEVGNATLGPASKGMQEGMRGPMGHAADR